MEENAANMSFNDCIIIVKAVQIFFQFSLFDLN